MRSGFSEEAEHQCTSEKHKIEFMEPFMGYFKIKAVLSMAPGRDPWGTCRDQDSPWNAAAAWLWCSLEPLGQRVAPAAVQGL